jgi:hypothetical protein
LAPPLLAVISAWRRRDGLAKRPGTSTLWISASLERLQGLSLHALQ